MPSRSGIAQVYRGLTHKIHGARPLLGPRQRCNETSAERVCCRREDDRYRRRRLLCREDYWVCIRDNDLESDELRREFRDAFAASLRPAILIIKLRPAIQPSSPSRCKRAATWCRSICSSNRLSHNQRHHLRPHHLARLATSAPSPIDGLGGPSWRWLTRVKERFRGLGQCSSMLPGMR